MKRFIEPVLSGDVPVFLLFGTGITARGGRRCRRPMQSDPSEAIVRTCDFSRRFARRTGNGSRGTTSPQIHGRGVRGDGLEGGERKDFYFQSVPPQVGSLNEAKTTVTLVRGGKEESWFSQGFHRRRRSEPGRYIRWKAPVVYVGAGVTAPNRAYETTTKG